jgi:hypothetical protein
MVPVVPLQNGTRGTITDLFKMWPMTSRTENYTEANLIIDGYKMADVNNREMGRRSYEINRRYIGPCETENA